MNEEIRRVVTFVGATGRVLRFQMRDDTGVVVDVSGYDSAAISGKLGTTEKIKNAVCDIEADVNGWVEYTPAAGEIDTTGDIRCNLKLVAATLPDYTEEFIIEVATPHDYS